MSGTLANRWLNSDLAVQYKWNAVLFDHCPVGHCAFSFPECLQHLNNQYCNEYSGKLASRHTALRVGNGGMDLFSLSLSADYEPRVADTNYITESGTFHLSFKLMFYTDILCHSIVLFSLHKVVFLNCIICKLVNQFHSAWISHISMWPLQIVIPTSTSFSTWHLQIHTCMNTHTYRSHVLLKRHFTLLSPCDIVSFPLTQKCRFQALVSKTFANTLQLGFSPCGYKIQQKLQKSGFYNQPKRDW